MHIDIRRQQRRGARLSRIVAALALAGLAPPVLAAAAEPWWQHAVIYEIYPRSFGDADGDGVGDLNGITAHLPYLQRLGVDAIWIAPLYPSPQVDFGYDISDYRAVDPQYGTLADFDRLVATAKRHGVRVILDFVLNHTSDRHPWFLASAASRSGAKSDWYVWSDGVAADAPGVGAYQRRFVHDGRVPPNNWTSEFGGSAWEWMPARHQFYYHRFYAQQPDLNWRNPAVVDAMLDVLRFWLDRGVAGFRLDAPGTLFEDAALPNEPEAGGVNAFGDPKLRRLHTDDLPEVHGIVRRMRTLIDSYPGDRVLIGETWVGDAPSLRRWYGVPKMDQLQLPMDTMLGFGDARYSPDWFRPRLIAAQAGFGGGQPLFVFDNHDTRRSIDRFGDGVHDIAIAKGVAAILYGSRATALTYYGAEIGMRTHPPTRREDVRDPIGVTGWPEEKGRDGERTPMQWTAGPQAGFSINPKTWLPVSADHATINVATEGADAASLLRWNERLIALRRSEPALHDGTMTVLEDMPADVLAWTRDADGAPRVLVAINMGAAERTLPLTATRVETLAASDPAVHADASALVLPPFTTWIGRVVSHR